MQSSKESKNESTSSYRHGPLRKTTSTIMLDEIIQRLFNEKYEHTFSLKNNEVVLTFRQKNKSDTADEKKSSRSFANHYNITCLLKSANLQHLDPLTKDFLEKCNKKLNIGAPIYHFFDAQIKALKKQIEETPKQNQELINILQNRIKDIEALQEHVPSVNYYTSNIFINHFLRGHYDKIFQNDDINNEARTYFLTAMIVADFLNRYPTEIESDHVNSVDIHRFEIHDISNSFIDILRKIQNTQNSIVMIDPAFTSTSENKLSVTGKKPEFDYADPYFNFIFYTGLEEHKKTIEDFSMVKEEREVLIPPTAKEIYMLGKAGPFVLCGFKTIRPLELEVDHYMPQIALRFAYDKYLSQPYQDKSAHEAIQVNEVTIERPNHGLAHTARQVRHVEDVIKFFIEQGKTDNIKNFCKKFQDYPLLGLIQTAAVFLSVGRTNEKSFKDDPAGYKKARETAAEAFEKFLIQFNPDLAALRQFIPLSKAAILDLGNPEYISTLFQDKNRSDDNKLNGLIIFHILNTAHILDVPRCLDTGKEILVDRLSSFASVTSIDKLWELSSERLKITGDYLTTTSTGRDNPNFCECSTSVTRVEEKLGLFQKTLQISDIQNRAKRDEAAFEILRYLSTIKKLNLKIISEDLKMSKLIIWAFNYISNNNLLKSTDEITRSLAEDITKIYTQSIEKNSKTILEEKDEFDIMPENISFTAINHLRSHNIYINVITNNRWKMIFNSLNEAEQLEFSNCLIELNQKDPNIITDDFFLKLLMETSQDRLSFAKKIQKLLSATSSFKDLKDLLQQKPGLLTLLLNFADNIVKLNNEAKISLKQLYELKPQQILMYLTQPEKAAPLQPHSSNRNILLPHSNIAQDSHLNPPNDINNKPKP